MIFQRYWIFVALCLGALACNPPNSSPETPHTSTTAAKPTKEEAPIQKVTTPSSEVDKMVESTDNPNRFIWQKPDLVIDMLGDLSGKTVADIGAGYGYFAFRIARKAEKVIAVEIDKSSIHFMDSMELKMPDRIKTAFETRLARADNPLLQPDELDAIIVVNTYGYIGNRSKYLQHLKKALKPGGKLLVIDFKKATEARQNASGEFKIKATQVLQELEQSGFTILKLDNEVLEYQYLILAEKSAL